jgi:hypothetical protein
VPVNTPIPYNRRYKTRRLPKTSEHWFCGICGEWTARPFLKQIVVEDGKFKGLTLWLAVNHKGCRDYLGYTGTPAKPVVPVPPRPPYFAPEGPPPFDTG